VEAGKTFEAAVLREACEETGLQQARLQGRLGELIQTWPGRLFTLQLASVFARPDPSSFEWAFLPRGVGVDCLRTQPGFVQVSYVEGDVYPDPAYTTYQITGWVREGCLTDHLRRVFFHLTTEEETLPEWQQAADKHTFTLLWADTANLPEIVPAQCDYWTRFREQILNI
jgi:8-oxo-dGTP pyrophosphatase MutT (NUDIX family)